MNKMLPDMTPHRMLLDVNGSTKNQISNLVRFNQHIWPFQSWQWRDCLFSTPYGSKDICSPHDEHKSSGPRPVKLCLDK